jgi:hypothetical protein
VSALNTAALRAATFGARLFGPAWPRDAAALIASATKGRGLPDEDMAEATAGLDVLLRSAEAEAHLSPLGRAGLVFDATNHVRNLRRLADEEAREPAITRAPVIAPLFITGLPRSGTSFLHKLLSLDAASGTPRVWQTLYPYPDAGVADTRRKRVQRQLAVFGVLAPEMRNVHPMDADSPQECTEITAQLFQSLRYETLYQIPTYKTWVAARGHAAAYRFHRRFLQHLQHQAPNARWVLKCPDHVFALPALRATHPDARVVFLHRDPLQVLASVASLTETLRAPFAEAVDRAAIGRQVTQDWAHGADIMVEEARASSLPAEQVLHLRYQDVVGQPLETVERLYAHFGLSLDSATRKAMADYIAARPRGGYGENQYSLAQYGLDPDDIASRFAAYTGMFNIGSARVANAARQSEPSHG